MARTTPRRYVGPPLDVEAGMARAQEVLVKAFDRQNGKGVDWAFMLWCVFRLCFRLIDEYLTGDAREKLLRKIEAGLYNRLAGNPDESKTTAPAADPGVSNTAEVKSPRPRSPKGAV